MKNIIIPSELVIKGFPDISSVAELIKNPPAMWET